MSKPESNLSTPQPSDTPTEPSPSEVAKAEAKRAAEIAEERMAEYLWDGTVDGECFDGDPADLDFF